ncbi:hypothetical protein [Haloplanus salilacus]|uniref:hypothetical protein n=1 Tax=Haloplanus salilacus TaxID=2949994 RepID=UPI0030D31B7B
MSVISQIYDNTIRDILPRKLGVYNSVPRRAPRLFDQQVNFPNYEDSLVNAVTNIVKPTDDVTVVGGGWGVTAVHAARRGTSVDVYEANAAQVAEIEFTLSLSKVSSITDIHHALVGPAKHVYRDGAKDAATISPSDLPESDVLELDCEGAEIEILEELSYQPRAIIVEVHPQFNATRDRVSGLLTERGYNIINSEFEDEETGVEVLTAVTDDETR